MARFCLGYTGCHDDHVIGGYPLGNGYRVYLPGLMRFSRPDEASPFALGGVNPYAYCEADPINHADPSGHFGEALTGAFKSMTAVLPIGGRRAVEAELEEVVVHRNIPDIVVHPRAGAMPSRESVSAQGSDVARAVSPSPPRVRYPPALHPKTDPIQVVATGEVFELHPPEIPPGKYRIERARGKNPRPRPPDGLFIYVNTIEEPDKVYLMNYVHPLNQGHTSIPRFLYGDAVPAYYAGEMKFSNGEMDYFNFASGHYNPPRSYAEDYLPFGTPMQRRLLPRERWRDYERI